MKTYILIPMALLSFASVALTENKAYLLATALFYNDGKGHQMVSGGRIPEEIIIAIRKDIKTRFGDTYAKVVPLFRNKNGASAFSKVTDFVNLRYDHVYLTEIPKWLASKVVQTKSKIIKKKKSDKLEDLVKVMRENEKPVETNSIAQEKLNETDILSINNIAPLPRAYYMPNTVFYAVETKCKTPTDYSCNLKKSHGLPNFKSFKKIFHKTTPWYSHLDAVKSK